MRILFAVLALTLAVAVAAASTTPITTTQIDEISYKLVKARETEPPTLPLFFPTLAYSNQGEIQVLVIAIPYSPNDQASLSLFKELTSAIMKLPTRPTDKWGEIWGEVADKLKQFRNVYFPYETFKVKLIFVIFVRTKTLMDLAVDSVKELIQSDDDNKFSGALYYATGILAIMSHNKIVNNVDEKINEAKNELNKITIEIKENIHSYQDSGKKCVNTIKDEQGNVICVKYEQTIVSNFNITLKYNTYDQGKIKENVFYREDAISTTIKIYYDKNDKVISDQCEIEINFNNVKDSLQREVLEKILGSAKDKALSLLPLIVPSVNQKDKLKVLFGEVDNDVLKKFLYLLYNKLYKYFNSTFTNSIATYSSVIPTQVKFKVCPSDNILSFAESMITTTLKNYISSSINNYLIFVKSMYNDIDNINRDVTQRFLNTVADKITSDAVNAISQEVESFSENAFGTLFSSAVQASANVALNCLKESITGLGEQVISGVPVVGQLYAIANGIAGALQREIGITGIVKSENVWGGSVLYTVNTPNICIAGGTIDKMSVSDTQNVCGINNCNSGNCFKSWPSATEAIVQGIIGFISGIAKTFTGNVGEFVDMIPVVREVDVPSDNTYFMIPAKPGIYKLEIKLCVSNILSEIKNGIKEGIKESLTKSGTNVINNELVKVINSAILESGIVNNIERFTVNVKLNDNNNVNVEVSKMGDGSGPNELSVSTFIISFPPYAYGKLEGGVFKYGYSYDWFGFFRPFVVDGLALVKSNLQCSSTQGGGGGADGNTKNIESSVSYLCEKVSSQVNRSISEIVQSQLNSFISGVQPSGSSCSFSYIIGVGVSTFLNGVSEKLVNTLKDSIRGEIYNRCQEMLAKITEETSKSLNSLLGRAPFIGAVFTTTGGSGKGGDGLSFACAVKSSLGYLAAPLFNVVEDYSYLPSYLLAGLSIKPPESIVVRRCYSVVVSPYFVHKYQTTTVNEKNLPQLLLDYAEELAASSLATNLFNTAKKHPARVGLIDTIWFQKDSNYYICKPGINPLEGFKDCKKFNSLTELVRSDLFKEYISYMGRSDINFLIFRVSFEPKARDILNDEDFAPIRAFLSEAKSDKRSLIIPYVGGINTYFTAFKVYPAIAVRESLEDLNAYYMVIPYSAPARELFVLGTVGDYVIYDGEPKRSDNKPFLYIDLTGGSTR